MRFPLRSSDNNFQFCVNILPSTLARRLAAVSVMSQKRRDK